MNKYLNKLIEIFNLKHWDIDLVEVGLLEKDNVAETLFIDNDYKATIKLKKELEEKMLESLIHELIHIIKRNSQVIAIDNIINKEVFDIWFREMEKEQEVLAKGIFKLLKGDSNENKPKEIEKIKYYDDSINWVIDGVGQLSDLDKLIIDKLTELIDKVNEMSKDD